MKHTHFSLGTAFLCVTCNCVGSNSRACACCGDSTGLLNLACVLDRRLYNLGEKWGSDRMYELRVRYQEAYQLLSGAPR